MQRRIAVVGSFRAKEVQIYNFENPDFFKTLAESVGGWIYEAGHTLRTEWSNDHLPTQSRPELNGRQKLKKNTTGAKGTYTADPAHCRFLFQDTADYYALKGYIETATSSPTRGGRIELSISNEMLRGSTLKDTIAWPPVQDHIIGKVDMATHIDEGLIEIHEVSGRTEKERLRSLTLMDLIKPGEREVDLVIGIGGGKASFMMFSTAMERLKLLPLPYCGGEAQRLLTQCYARRDNRALQRLAYVFGHEMPETKTADGNGQAPYTPEDLQRIIRTLDSVEKFFTHPYRVFVAFPYGRTSDERTQQSTIFSAIQQAIQKIDQHAPERYPGATAIRVDESFFGSKKIHDEMWNQIRNSGVIMGELTPLDGRDGAPNANVFYELGFADGFNNNKPHFLVAREGIEIPFDLGEKRIHRWKDLDDLERVCIKQLAGIFESIRTNA